MPQIIKMLAVLFAAGFGVYSIWQPKIVAQAAGFDLPGNKGVAELRTSFGGLFVGLGIAPLILGSDVAYQMLGIAALVTLGVRLLTIALDGQDIVRRDFVLYALSELVSGIVLVIPVA